jgi:sulfur carrier protein
MELIVNGEARAVPDAATVADLLELLQVQREFVAVERNRQIVRRADQATTVLADRDCVEIVEFVGGG